MSEWVLEAPDDWTVSTLGDAATLVKDKVDPTQLPEVPYIGLEHIEAHTMRLLGHGRGADVKSAKSRFSAGDVLYGKLRPYLNKVVVPGFSGICSTDILVFTESTALASDYLAHFLNQLWVADRAHHFSNGVELPRVDWKSLSSLRIAYPASKVQQRVIVEHIEAAQAFRSSANEHLQTAKQAIERFRQAVIAAACSGRLTAEWRESHAIGPKGKDFETSNAKANELFKDKVRGTSLMTGTGPDVPNGWIMTNLSDVSLRITSGSRDWSRFYGHGSGTFVMAQNVRRGYLDWSFRQAVDPPINDASRDRSQIKSGDLLVTIVGANTGDVGLVTDDRPEHYVCQSVALVRLTNSELTGFLNLWFNSPNHGQAYFDDCIYGAGRPHLSFDQLKAAPVAVPPLAERQEIVRRAEELLAAGDQLSQRIEKAAARVERSSQAVLAKAFRGGLTEDAR